MGAALWVTSALSVFLVARTVPPGRPRGYLTELALVLVSAVLLGFVATALDFGGWRDPDWRAGAFATLGSAAAAGAFRAVRLARN